MTKRNYFGRISVLRSEIYQLIERETTCHPDDRTFYQGISDQFATQLKLVQAECITIHKEAEQCQLPVEQCSCQ